jgi:hypothetical protein
MVLNPFKAIFPKKNAYKADSLPNQPESNFSSELSPESAQYSTAVTNTAVSAGTSTAKIATVVGLSSAMVVAMAVTVIATAVVLTANKSTTETLLGYQSNCTNTSIQCNVNIGLYCINGLCNCNSTQYYNGSFCGMYLFILFEKSYNNHIKLRGGLLK